jgi:hypothetical protein
VKFSPILGRAPLVEDTVKAVGVDHIGSRDSDVVARRGERGVDEASCIGIVRPEQDALRVLRDDLHDQMCPGMIGARLE